MLKFIASIHYRAGAAFHVIPCFLDDYWFNRASSYKLSGSTKLTTSSIDLIDLSLRRQNVCG